jgi:phage baseplate assembly protein W
MKPLDYNYIESDPARQFSDVNTSFTKHPLTGDVSIKTNDDSIKQSLRNLVLLNKNEKPFHPEIGGDIYRMLFENFDEPGTEAIVQNDLIALITQYEPRIDINDITVDFNYDSNSVSITIYYVILNTLQPSSVEIFLKNVR